MSETYEATFVRERRARGVPWPHIAAQLASRKSANDLRALYEPGFAPPPVLIPPPIAKPTPPRVRVFRGDDPTRRQLDMLALLDGTRRLCELAKLLGAYDSQACDLCARLAGKGLARRNDRGRWEATAAGLNWL